MGYGGGCNRCEVIVCGFICRALLRVLSRDRVVSLSTLNFLLLFGLVVGRNGVVSSSGVGEGELPVLTVRSSCCFSSVDLASSIVISVPVLRALDVVVVNACSPRISLVPSVLLSGPYSSTAIPSA